MINAVSLVQYRGLSHNISNIDQTKKQSQPNVAFGASFSSVTKQVGFWAMVASLAVGCFALYPVFNKVFSPNCLLAPVDPMNLAVAKWAGGVFSAGVVISFLSKAFKSHG